MIGWFWIPVIQSKAGELENSEVHIESCVSRPNVTIISINLLFFNLVRHSRSENPPRYSVGSKMRAAEIALHSEVNEI